MKRFDSAAWRRFFKLSGRERSDFVLASLLLPLMIVAVRARGFRWMRKYLEPPRNVTPKDSLLENGAPISAAHRAAHMVEAASGWGLARGNCLSQSLALCYLLRRRGIPALVRIGGRKDAHAFEAHAWVELAGVPINDSAGLCGRFAFFEHPAAQAPHHE